MAYTICSDCGLTTFSTLLLDAYAECPRCGTDLVSADPAPERQPREVEGARARLVPVGSTPGPQDPSVGDPPSLGRGERVRGD